MNLKVIFHPAEEGGFWAEVPALPGCVSQGETRAEVEVNIGEAIAGWLAAGEESPDTTPSDTGPHLNLRFRKSLRHCRPSEMICAVPAPRLHSRDA